MNEAAKAALPPQNPNHANQLEIIKGLQNLLMLAEQGKIASFVCCATTTDHQAVQAVVLTDPQLAQVCLTIDALKTKLVARAIQLESAQRLSPIIRPAGVARG